MTHGASCCFTGHRNVSNIEAGNIDQLLHETIDLLIRQNVVRFYCGGALGFDTLAAKAVLDFKRTNPQIQLILAVPFRDQDRLWQQDDKRIYRKIYEQADEIHILSEQYYSGCFHKRNRYIVDHSDVCVCYLAKNRGGTFYTVNYAQKHNKRIINLAFPSVSAV